MYFLIDFENVHNTGLEGLEYLTKDDTVNIFYSTVCEKIKRCRLAQILDSGCNWEINKLAHTGKNALDFYIATSIGEIFASEPNACVGIVSNDKGFRAVKDYWKVRLAPQNRLVQGNNVSICMSNGYDLSGRSEMVKEDIDVVSIEDEYAKFLERKRVENTINDCFVGTVHERLIPEIMKIISNEASPKAKYIATIKSFGKKEGLEVYRIIRNLSFTVAAS